MHKKFRVKTNGRIQAIIENRAKDAIVKSKSKTFASRAEAEAWAANMFVVMERQYQQAKGQVNELSDTQLKRVVFRNHQPQLDAKSSVKDVINAYLGYTNSMPLPASSTTQDALRTICKYQLANYPLCLINYDALQNYCTERSVTCSSSTTRIEISSLKRALRELREMNKFSKATDSKQAEALLESSYATLKKNGLIADSKSRNRRIKDWKELRKLLTSAREYSSRSKSDIRYDYLILLYIETTLRVSELLSLRWEDIDFNRHRFTIAVGKNVRPGKSGTREAPRIVPLTKRAYRILKTLKGEGDKAGLVFNITTKYLTTLFPRFKAHAGINGLQLRDLRREGVSRMVEKGYSVLQIAVFTGHRDIDMIVKIYNAAQAVNIARR
jgi:integrase